MYSRGIRGHSGAWTHRGIVKLLRGLGFRYSHGYSGYSPGYYQALTGTHRCSRTRGRALTRRCSRTARRARARRTRWSAIPSEVLFESPGREYPVSTDVSTPEYPQCIPDCPCSDAPGATRSDADGVVPRRRPQSTDGSTPSTSVSTLITPSAAGRSDGVVPRLAEALFSSAAERRGQARVPGEPEGVLWVLTWAL